MSEKSPTFPSTNLYAQCRMTKTMTILTTLFIIGCSSLLYAQNADSLTFKRLTITTTLTDYIPTLRLNTANINIGAEIYLKNSKSIAFNFGLVKSYGPTGPSASLPIGWFALSSENTIGFKGQVEGRHYLKKRKLFGPAMLIFWPQIFQFRTQELDNTGYYIAFHSSFQATATTRQETILDYIDDMPFPESYHYKENIYTVDRNVLALNMKFGYQCIKKSGLTVDFAVGLGGQYISSSPTKRQGTETDYPNSDKDFGGKLFDKGTSFYPNIVYQLRLGWSL
jgi:hypothetical protein